MRFKAAMFDFDGTVTEKGVYGPSQKMADALVKLSKSVPVGFCTGRQLESFAHRGLTELLREISPGDRHPFLKNLFLFAENGAVGYDFDTESNDFVKFYEIPWPDDFIDKNELRRKLAAAIEEYGSIYDNAHRIVIVMRTNLHDVENRDVDDVYALSQKIYDATIKLLLEVDPHFEKFLHVGNSGIGVIVGPAEGDKDTAIKKFAEFLRERRGMDFDYRAREILVVGDSPQAGGNDYYFLKGKNGTPYTVGYMAEDSELPKTVHDNIGGRLLHEDGTLALISRFFQ